MRRLPPVVLIATAVLWIANSKISGQQSSQPPPDIAETITLRATTVDELRRWDPLVTEAARSGALRLRSATVDPLLPSRVVERYEQFHNGVRIWGADVVRDSERGVPHAIFGELVPVDIQIPATPGLGDDEARAVLLRLGGSEARLLTDLELVIRHLDSGDYRLAYTAVLSGSNDVVRIFIDAVTGVELLRFPEIKTQAAAVGSGRGVLRSALAWAMTQRVLTYNAAALCKVPRPTPKVVTPLTADQGRQLLEAAAGHRLGAMVIVSLTMGLRIGEASGLSWAAIDLNTRTLRVEQQLQALGKAYGLTLAPLKTRNSRRTLALPTLAVKALKAHRKAQLAERLRAGAEWKNAHDLVFTMPNGQPVNPSHLRDVLRLLLTAAGLPQIRYHALRHTAATLLLLDGTPLFDVSRVLGHSEIGTTSDIYGHLVPEMAASAAARMDALLKTRKA